MSLSRTNVILAAMQREISERRQIIDASADIAEVTITVRLTPGQSWVRGTQYTEERITRARMQRTS